MLIIFHWNVYCKVHRCWPWLALNIAMTGRWLSLGPPASSTNKIDHRDITKILLKLAFSTKTLPPNSILQCVDHETTKPRLRQNVFLEQLFTKCYTCSKLFVLHPIRYIIQKFHLEDFVPQYLAIFLLSNNKHLFSVIAI